MSIFRTAAPSGSADLDPSPEALTAALQESAAEKQNAIKEAIVRHGATVAYVNEASGVRLRQIAEAQQALADEETALLKVQALAAGNSPDPLEA